MSSIPTKLEEIPDEEILLSRAIRYNRRKELSAIIKQVEEKTHLQGFAEEAKACLRILGTGKTNCLNPEDKKEAEKFEYKMKGILTKKSREFSLDLAEGFISHANALYCLAAVKKYWNPTFWHCARVSMFPVMMQGAYKLSQNDAKTLYEAGLSHADGKVAVPKIIHNKRGKLTKNEWKIMKPGHVENASVILSELGIAKPDELVHRIVIEHHENEDGTGYPRGLKRKEINDLTYTIKIFDVFDALTNPRVYRAGTFSQRTAADYIYLHSMHNKEMRHYFLKRVSSKGLLKLVGKDNNEYSNKIMFDGRVGH